MCVFLETLEWTQSPRYFFAARIHPLMCSGYTSLAARFLDVYLLFVQLFVVCLLQILAPYNTPQRNHYVNWKRKRLDISFKTL